MATHGVNHFQLQSLTAQHKEVAALIAQGLGPTEISEAIDFTPQYVTMLTRDPLFKDYLTSMTAIAEARLEMLFTDVVKVIDEGLRYGGTTEEKLKAARLQMEATGRIGKRDRADVAFDSSVDRLNNLASRLIVLQQNARNQGNVINAEILHTAEAS